MAQTSIVAMGDQVVSLPQQGSQPAYRPTDADWEHYKPIILRMFENEKLAKVVEEMKKLYGFTASIDMYRRRIYKLWRVRQHNHNEKEMCALAFIANARARMQKDTLFDLRGRYIDTREIRRYFARKHRTVTQVAESITDMEYPQGLRVLSPGPVPRIADPSTYSHVEWLLWNATKFTKSQVEALENRAKPEWFNPAEVTGHGNLQLRFLLSKALNTMDRQLVRKLAGVWGGWLIPSLRHLVFENGLLEILVTCLSISEKIHKEELQVKANRWLAGYLIAESNGANPSMVALLRGLPGCRALDMFKILLKIEDIHMDFFKKLSKDQREEIGLNLCYSRYSWRRFAADLLNSGFGSSRYPLKDNEESSLCLKCLEYYAFSKDTHYEARRFATRLLEQEVPQALSFDQFLSVLFCMAMGVDLVRGEGGPLCCYVTRFTLRFLYEAYKFKFGPCDVQTIICEGLLQKLGIPCKGRLRKEIGEATYPLFYSLMRTPWLAYLSGQNLGSYMQDVGDRYMRLWEKEFTDIPFQVWSEDDTTDNETEDTMDDSIDDDTTDNDNEDELDDLSEDDTTDSEMDGTFDAQSDNGTTQHEFQAIPDDQSDIGTI